MSVSDRGQVQLQNAFDFVGGLGLHEHCRVRVGHDFLGEGSVKMRTPVGHDRVAGFLQRSLGLARKPIIEWNGVRIGTSFIEIRSGFVGSGALMLLGT